MQPETTLEKVFLRLKPAQKTALKRLGLETVRDILYYFPSRYGTIAHTKTIDTLSAGEQATVIGNISGIKTSKGFRTRVAMAEAKITDHTGSVKAVWFNQPYIAPMLHGMSTGTFHGRVNERKGELYMSNPEFEKTDGLPIDVGDSLFSNGENVPFDYPVYSETKGITSKWFYHAIGKILQSGALDEIPDPLSESILSRYSLPALKTALFWIHTPKKRADAESARKRFAFEEIFCIQLARKRARREYENMPAFAVRPSEKEVQKFVSRFPFPATDAQKKAVTNIFADLKQGRPMARLLEGDVGSGKTAVAAAASYAIVTTAPEDAPSARLEAAYMAPTEILARQHFASFIDFFKDTGVPVGLITGSECRKFPSKTNPNESTHVSKSQFLKWVSEGLIPIVVGTHALIQKTVQFKNLALVVIDEQHRFGINQRFALTQKGSGKKPVPHLLSMTATPIPRTLALTIYGDLDLSLLDELPKGRQYPETKIVPPNKRASTYEKIRETLTAGRQCYVICPRINEPDPEKKYALYAKSVKEEAVRLKKNIFPEFEIGILHGKMTPKEKDAAMRDFSDGKTRILVATSIVEVGVNVPNATVIVIEGAERFGLSQLHQLRGRVMRSTHRPYCYIFTDSGAQNTANRLKALASAKNGFELAELDMSLRGAGTLSGERQWGVSDIGMEAIKNLKLVEAARSEVLHILTNDPSLAAHPALKEKAEAVAVHFE
ncbi:MAG: ATP-dependent DNA helicase RecG [Candidatus Lloydbacteria bacterium CG22_combo_CG10-13_8_21_14_all_47_15]|uniref:ATP-dependent DNA helicase RecG n=1 Tax=Candidatus Lloydbacteria bacterium CG22_combo_CG10-13_8_21_14_all_47_15 TaxID=1974635 RepID=A0A2H0CVP2_9BACT|nr:MAG: ATP-dependent DNA helicase RecG [Candidatus Lloydbacteria bacterium CG22_combo_CG10-13_8_21_14_all_47_15]